MKKRQIHPPRRGQNRPPVDLIGPADTESGDVTARGGPRTEEENQWLERQQRKAEEHPAGAGESSIAESSPDQ